MDTLVPGLKDEIEVFLNRIPLKIIKQMDSEGEGFTDNFEGIRILTVGRLAEDMTIHVLVY
ncbi:hypothetical protein SDC9_196602 [bioreactor metagenome]|uniref:Uncharacterized protein n=1 Tax=bioreactor metagenome TaxID=1076179 RepID=A0A645IET8_9ZZZZ